MKSNYRRKPELRSRRLRGFNYATEGAYFITINTKNRIHHFGKIKEGEMILSEEGKILEREWEKSADLRSEIELGVWQVMPDHFHAIVYIVYSNDFPIPNYKHLPQTPDFVAPMQDVSKNLSSLIRGFKGAVTRKVRQSACHDFSWQASFHDRIIRNSKELKAIRLYIRNNPSRWSS